MKTASLPLIPRVVGFKAQRPLKRELYDAGYAHALQGGKITEVKHLKQSFRAGFRDAKLYLRALHKSQGVLPFPVQGRLKFKSV